MIRSFLIWFFKKELDEIIERGSNLVYQKEFLKPFLEIVKTRRSEMFGPPARIFTQLVDELEEQEKKMNALATLFWETVELLPAGEQKQSIKRRSAFLGALALRHLYE